MSAVELTLLIAGIVAYTVVLLIVLRWALFGVVWVYRQFKPAPPPVRDFDLQAGDGYKFIPEPGQPFFGANAKAFFVQAAAAIAVVLFLRWATEGWLPDLIRAGVRALIG